ncbi:hypothetical protein ACFSW8_05960 [Rubritalea tangerina]|uniref:Uncharacterized protein n=2 Tax=Rubritalea tangerina TaxID=430798 RepID=A0ABW4Z9D4_9BACT
MKWRVIYFSALALLVGGVVRAQEVESVKFPKTHQGVSLEGKIKGYAFKDYKVTAKKGQRLVVTLETKHLSTSFLVYGAGKIAGKDAALFNGTVNGNEYQGGVDADGVLTIRVLMMRNAARRDESASYEIGVELVDGKGEELPKAREMPIYFLAYSRGVDDGWSGMSRSPKRYDSLYSELTKGEFAKGYEAGYKRGIKVPQPTRAYKKGVMRGVEDGACGLSRTPSRHASMYEQSEAKDFAKGYEEGYNTGIK